jgi:hypothetical protein
MSTLVIDDISNKQISVDLLAQKIQTITFLSHTLRESISCAISEIDPNIAYITLDELRKLIYKYGNYSVKCSELVQCLLP